LPGGKKMIGWVGSTANLTYDGKTARQVVAIRIWVNDKIPMRSNTHWVWENLIIIKGETLFYITKQALVKYDHTITLKCIKYN
jgi:hypothetical protein